MLRNSLTPPEVLVCVFFKDEQVVYLYKDGVKKKTLTCHIFPSLLFQYNMTDTNQ